MPPAPPCKVQNLLKEREGVHSKEREAMHSEERGFTGIGETPRLERYTEENK
jgi:hypothetical protein